MSDYPRGRVCRARRRALVVLCIVAMDLIAPPRAWPQLVAPTEDGAALTYYLETSINGIEKHLIVRVDRVAGKLRISADELGELGVRLDGLPFDADGQIALDAIPDLTYDYDDAAQRLALRLPEYRLVPERLGYAAEPAPPATRGTGLVLNYGLNLQTTRMSLERSRALTHHAAPTMGGGAYGSQPLRSDADYEAGYDRTNRALSLATEFRFFSPYGLVQNSGVSAFEDGRGHYVRQDTYWTYADEARLLTYTVGDFVSASLPWSRAVRMGGVSLAHNFDTRPDLVTFPVPALGGSAVVPTTVDLYVNGLQQFSGRTEGGPFVITTPPTLTGAGTATLVYRDQLGREVIVNRPLYMDTRLLAKGLSEYAVQAGYARRAYGSISFDYASTPAATAAIRYGVTDAVTLEGHAEVTRGLRNAGFGGMVQLGMFGVVNAAVSGSGGAAQGGQLSAGYQYASPRFSLSVQATRASAQYRDLGTVEGIPVPQRQLHALISVPVADRQTVSLSYARQDASYLGGSRIVSLGYTATLGSRVNVFANVFKDYDQAQAVGGFIGVTITFGGNASASATVSSNSGRQVASLTASRPVDYDKGGLGWNVQADGGTDGYRRALGRMEYRGRYGDASVTLDHGSASGSTTTHASFYGAGSLVLMDGALLAGRQIYDAFAVVSTDGIPDVPVLRENREIGRTNSGGRLLATDLLPFNTNRLSIDTLQLPVDASIGVDRLLVVPATRAGLVARFPVSRYTGATAILVDERGQPLREGSHVTLEGSDATALVGYDGQVFLPALQAVNRLTVTFGDRRCTVEVPFAQSEVMTTIGPFVCEGGATR